ncbi:FecR family protein [Candidatus Symbiopectobacterium sp. NZEC151]|uniref:FecR family protein n=1 Tax=Candidatus Symbiopectobacterium sp. NZEC151 TaxID=2820470 RepID=UPI002226C29C|nr:FecR family protein [Candidatus Symbiopectobacterium sp. NZEC151]MCW2475116.1 FecR family protein [Candidatus Symbiopectobacterium sp. NZEC151]
MTPTETQIREQARDWFISLRDNPSRAQRAACDQWRQSHPAHDDAYRAVEAVWQATAAPGKRLAEKESEALAVYLTAIKQAKRHQRARRWLVSASACCALVMAGVLWLENPYWMQDVTASHVASKGERRDVTLADGSRLLLDADSAFSVAFTPQGRRVHLLRGAAFFDVTPSQTPFVVATAAGDVRVLGTQFDVRLIDDAALVTLAKGSVAVTAGSAMTPTVLKPGEQARFSASGTHAPVSVNVADEMAWRDGRYIFYRARLADVVREVERYRSGRILISASALANETVTGSFSLADSDAALASLQASVGFQMRKVTERLVILSP